MADFDLLGSNDREAGPNSSLDDNILHYLPEEIPENLNYILSRLQDDIKSEDGLEYATFALEKVMLCVPVDDLEFKIFKTVCPYLLDTCVLGIDGVTENRDSLMATQINSSEAVSFVLNTCTTVVKTLNSSCEYLRTLGTMPFKKVPTLLDVVHKIVFKVYSLSEEQLKTMSESIFMTVVDELKEKYFSMMTKNIIFDSECDDEMDQLEGIVEEMSESGTKCYQQMNFVSDVWRTIFFLIEKYESLRTGFNASKTVQHLSNELISYLEKMVPANLKSDELKFMNFWLKVVVRLSKMFSNFPKDCWVTLLRLLLNLCKRTPSYLFATGFSNDGTEEITKNLITGANALLSSIFDQPQFSSHMTNVILTFSKENPYGCLILLLRIVKKLNLASTRQTFLNQDLNILEMIFDCFGNCHIGIVQGEYLAPGAISSFKCPTDLYEFVMVNVTAWVVTLTADEFSEVQVVVIRNVVQPDPWRAMLACDVLCVAARYAEAKFCHNLVETLLPVLKHMETRTARPEFVYLSCLVSRLFSLCEPQFMNNLHVRHNVIENLLIWRCLGINGQEAECLAKLVTSWMDSSSADVNVVEALEVLAFMSKEGAPPASVVKVVDDAWQLVRLPSSARRYLCAISSLTVAILRFIPKDVLSRIFVSIAANLDETSAPCVQLAFLEIVENMALLQLPSETALHEQITAGMSHVFKIVVLSKSPSVQITGLQSLSNFASKSPHADVIKRVAAKGTPVFSQFVSFLQKELSPCENVSVPCSYMHQCKKYELEINVKVDGVDDIEVPCSKKLRLHTQVLESDNILKSFEDDVARLRKNFWILDFQQRNRVKCLCKDLLADFG